MVRVHQQQPADALLLAGAAVEHRAALLERAGVDAEVGELADAGSVTILNASAANGSLVGGLALELLVALEVHAGGSAAGRAATGR